MPGIFLLFSALGGDDLIGFLEKVSGVHFSAELDIKLFEDRDASTLTKELVTTTITPQLEGKANNTLRLLDMLAPDMGMMPSFMLARISTRWSTVCIISAA